MKGGLQFETPLLQMVQPATLQQTPHIRDSQKKVSSLSLEVLVLSRSPRSTLETLLYHFSCPQRASVILKVFLSHAETIALPCQLCCGPSLNVVLIVVLVGKGTSGQCSNYTITSKFCLGENDPQATATGQVKLVSKCRIPS